MRTVAFSALLAGMLSIGFAYLEGLPISESCAGGLSIFVITTALRRLFHNQAAAHERAHPGGESSSSWASNLPPHLHEAYALCYDALALHSSSPRMMVSSLPLGLSLASFF